ncbi:MAG: polyprenol monophosphomannose synthase [Armatimonadota bacterium]
MSKDAVTNHQLLWIVVPTDNESDNMAMLVEQILTIMPSAHLVVVDDGSPDGTAKIVERFAQRDSRVHLLRRPKKLGYASAVVTGLQFALSNGASIVGYMDADLSHDPKALPLLIEAVQNGADIAIGSRYVNGGEIVGWAWQRKVLSQCANWLIRLLLRLPIHDATSGFRVFRQAALERLDLGRIRVDGYAFQFVSVALAIWEGLKVVEVPISFCERKFGRSKMSWRIVFEAMMVLPKLAWWRLTGHWLGAPVLKGR